MEVIYILLLVGISISVNILFGWAMMRVSGEYKRSKLMRDTDDCCFDDISKLPESMQRSDRAMTRATIDAIDNGGDRSINGAITLRDAIVSAEISAMREEADQRRGSRE